MRSRHVFHAVDSHTEGMPTRVVTGGVGAIPGDSMAARRAYAIAHLDQLRTLLMYEPRGHPAMSGAILQPPTRPDADAAVLFIEVSGFLPMCGHGTIGVATVLVETGMVPVSTPVTTIRLETPAGLVVADVAVRSDGAATSVTIRNVASFPVRHDAVVDVDGLGKVRYDLAYGGNFYAFVELAELGPAFYEGLWDARSAGSGRAAGQRLIDAGRAVMAAVNEADPPVHPAEPAVRGCHGVYFAAPGADARYSRHAMVIHPGWFDRSPCGTGTSARMAQLWSRGELPLAREFVNESVIGSRFTGRLLDETTVAGRSAVVPAVTGRAWVTGTAQYLLDPEDPFPAGFLL